MLVHILTNNRNDISTEWYILPLSVLTKRQEFYIGSGLIVDRIEEETSDSLSRTVTTKFVSTAAFEQYTADPEIFPMFKLRNEYNTLNNITTNTTTTQL